MITFLPCEDYAASAAVLDRQRLGKQRIEAYQLVRAISGQTAGWSNHPAARMWRGHVKALAFYGILMCDEWIKRGYADTMRPRFLEFLDLYEDVCLPKFPDQVHVSHRANLLRKNPEYYGQFGWTEDPSLPYFWPA